MGPSPTGRGPADRAGLVVLDPVDPAALGRVGLDRVGLVVTGRAGLAVLDLDRGQADPVDPAALGRVGLAVLGRAGLADPVDLVVLDLAGLGDPAALGRVGLAVMGRAGLADRAGLVVLDRAGPVDPVVLGRVGPVDLGDQGMGPAGLVDPAGMGPAGLVDPAGLDPAGPVDLGDQGMDPAGRVDPADRVDPVDQVDPAGRRRTHPGVRTSGVALRWAAPGMRRTASAHPTTVRRLHRDNMDSAGMMGLLPERRRRSGTGRRPRVAGAVRRLPVVGTAHGMVRRVTGATRSVISGRSITTATTRSRSLTRSLGDGASGSSESGSRWTDTTKKLTAFGPCCCRSGGREVSTPTALRPRHASAGK